MTRISSISVSIVITAFMLFATCFVATPCGITLNVAAGVLDDYDYHDGLSIVGSSDGVQTNYQVMIEVHNGTGTNHAEDVYLNGHALNWPYDIRFTKTDNTTNLDFWRESYTSDLQTVWVEFDSIAAYPSNTTIMIHYGYVSATDASNGDDTFIFFDHFPGSSLNVSKWGGDTGYATVAGSLVTVVGTGSAWKTIYSLVNDSPPSCLKMKATLDNPGTSNSEAGFRDPSTTDFATYWTGTPTKVRCYKDGTGTTNNSNWVADGTFEVHWTASSTSFYENGTQLTGSPITTNCPTKALPVYLSAYQATGYDLHCDWVFIRNYTSNEPYWGEGQDWLNFTYAMTHLEKHASNPLLSPNGSWEGSLNICDWKIVEESTTLRMYYTGHAEGAPSGIGLLTSPKDYPAITWTRYDDNPIYTNGSEFVRMGSIFKDNGTYYLYVNDGLAGTKVARLTSTDGINFTGNQVVLTPSGDETTVEDPEVYRATATSWFMYYCYRTAGETLPGIRYATSTDGITWSKQSGDLIEIGAGGQWDDTYIESHHMTYVAPHYVITYEAYGGVNWDIGFAYADSPSGPFTKFASNPIVNHSGIAGTYDEKYVATPWLCQFENVWYVYFVGGNATPYTNSVWKMGLASYGAEEEPPEEPPAEGSYPTLNSLLSLIVLFLALGIVISLAVPIAIDVKKERIPDAKDIIQRTLLVIVALVLLGLVAQFIPTL